MAPFVGVLSVPDVSQYQDRQIEESIGYFQQKATRAKPGVVSDTLHVFNSRTAIAGAIIGLLLDSQRSIVFLSVFFFTGSSFVHAAF